jgi:hypothetical protein
MQEQPGESKTAATAPPAAPDNAAFPGPGWGLVLFAVLMTLLLGLYALWGGQRRILPAGKWKNVVLAGGLTLVCAVISFYHLGSFDTPQTYYQGKRAGGSFYLDLGRVRTINELRYFLALGAGSYDIDFSTDRESFFGTTTIEQETVFSMVTWRVLRPLTQARYVRVTVNKPGAMLGEVALFGENRRSPLPVADVIPATTPFADRPAPKQRPDPRLVCDEPDRVPVQASYLNGMYFDECYHARSGFEYILGRDATETSHPPLGKLFISAGIGLFGFTPFGWRFMGALFGVLMVPLLYALALRLFKKSEWAFAAAFLLACDFMRFTQTRIATIDVFGVFWIILMFFFMHRAVSVNPFAKKPGKLFRELFFIGVCLGLGAASKWIVLYGAVGLAVIFIGSYVTKIARYIRSNLSKPNGFGREEADTKPKATSFRETLLLNAFLVKRHALVFSCSILLFFYVPAMIYLASYIPFMAARGPSHPQIPPLVLVLEEQKAMYDYHAGITASHDYSSVWYEWPVMIRPIWYYTGRTELPPPLVSDIYAFGNPAVWWMGTAAVAYLVVAVWVMGTAFLVFFLLQRLKRPRPDKDDGAGKRKTAVRRRLRLLLRPGLFILIALAAQYVPWIVIPRKLTFIYHFFASVPFLVLCIVLALKLIGSKRQFGHRLSVGLLGAALILFLLFYPLLSGALTDSQYVADVLRWLPGWFPYL